MTDEEIVQAYYAQMERRKQNQLKPKPMNITSTNIDKLIEYQRDFIIGSYDQFLRFGGPCVYFHLQCLAEGERNFLSLRHMEMLYATLTAWGMHRMGDSERTKTKLSEWDRFFESFQRNKEILGRNRVNSMLEMTSDQYASALRELKALYFDLDLTEADSTLVVNSKALFHLFPQFIPPIDRQYTIRFLLKRPDQWMTPDKKFKPIMLPQGKANQFAWFVETCNVFKGILDRLDISYVAEEQQKHHVTPPKLVDNAIVHYVRKLSGKVEDAD